MPTKQELENQVSELLKELKTYKTRLDKNFTKSKVNLSHLYSTSRGFLQEIHPIYNNSEDYNMNADSIIRYLARFNKYLCLLDDMLGQIIDFINENRERIENLEVRVTNIENRLDVIEQRLDNIDNHLQQIDNHLQQIDNSITNINNKLGQHDNVINKIIQNLTESGFWQGGIDGGFTGNRRFAMGNINLFAGSLDGPNYIRTVTTPEENDLGAML